MARPGNNVLSFMAMGAPVASVAFWLAAWQVASWAFAQPLLLPGPVEVVLALGEGVALPTFWASVGFSTVRIVGALAVAYVLALPLAAAAHRLPAIRVLLNPPLQAIKATPVVCVVVLLLLWLGAANVSFAAVLLMALPGLYFTTLEGLFHQDARMAELFDVHGVRGVRRTLACTWQQVLPYVQSASANVVGMAWKAGVAAELIGVPAGSIGERIYQSKLLIETADVLAWTVVVIALSVACERMVLALLRASGPAAIRVAVWLGGRAGRSHPIDAEGVELRDVRVAFDAIGQGIDLALRPGERRCLMAPSGQGKTTTLRLVAGLLAPISGHAQVPSSCAVLFQESRLIEDASALQNIALFLSNWANWGRGRFVCGKPGSRSSAKYDRAGAKSMDACIEPKGVASSTVNIEHLLRTLIPGIDPHAPVRTLSGGQRRRVELIRTMLVPSGIVLLDEPFTGLDAVARTQAAAFVHEHLDGRTLLIATHDPRDLEFESD